MLSIFAVIFFTACGDDLNEELVANPKENTPYQKKYVKENFILTTIDGENIKLHNLKDDGMSFDDYIGKKAVLLNVYATWCAPCVKEVPIMNNLQEKYSDLKIIAVTFDKDITNEQVRAFMNKHNIAYTVTVGPENFKLAKHLDDIKMVPEVFLYDKQGKFVKKFIGENPQETFEKYIDFTLDKK